MRLSDWGDMVILCVGYFGYYEEMEGLCKTAYLSETENFMSKNKTKR